MVFIDIFCQNWKFSLKLNRHCIWSGQLAMNKAVKTSLRSELHVWKLAMDSLSSHSHCWVVHSIVQMAVCFLQCKHGGPFFLHIFCCTWTWEITMRFKKESNNFVLVKDNWRPFAIFCEYKYIINLWNFVQKFFVIAKKMAKKFKEYFFAAPCIYYKLLLIFGLVSFVKFFVLRSVILVLRLLLHVTNVLC